MKKLTTAGALVLALGLLVPPGVIAATPDDEVTIRVMEMHEKSTSSVMNRIQLPEKASDKVTEEANYRKRLIEGKGQGTDNGLGDKDWERIREQERIYDMEQNQERELELVQDQIRDTEPDLANEQQTGQETGAGAK